MSRSPLHVRRLRIFFYMLLVLTVMAVVFVAYSTIALGARGRDEMRNSRQAQSNQVELMYLARALLDAETGQRGYLLSDDVAYLEPLNLARTEIQRLRPLLESALGTQAKPGLMMRKLDALIVLMLENIDESIDLKHRKGMPAALEFVKTDFGKSLMDEIRKSIASLSTEILEESRVYTERALETSSFRDRMIALLAIIGFAIGMLAVWAMRLNLKAMLKEDEMRLEAEQAGRESLEKSAFLANMSHEIRTPMNAIFGFTQLLESHISGERERFYLAAIKSSGDALLSLINDILDLSKIEAGQLKLVRAPTDLRELISTVAKIFSQMAMQKGLKLIIDLDRSLPRVVKLDPSRVRQILFNLVGNAIKYTDRGGITIRAWSQWTEGEQPSIRCVIEVIDTGIGIADEHLGAIFQPFTQIPDRDLPRPGTGLGLSIVKRLVEVLDGSIEVSSHIGRGSTFRVQFDHVELGAAEPEQVPLRGSLQDIAALSVLIVDDVELNRELLLGMFESTHHRVALAVNGEHALERARELKPDLVLMDIRMPGMDGRTALREMRADSALKEIKVIAVTASSVVGEEPNLRREFDGYVRKPFTLEALTAEMIRVFGSTLVDLPAPSADVHLPIVLLPGQAPMARALVSSAELLIDNARASMSTSDLAGLLEQLESVNATLNLNCLTDSVRRLREATQSFDLGAIATELDQMQRILERLSEAAVEEAI